jgi:hypothetical protein
VRASGGAANADEQLALGEQDVELALVAHAAADDEGGESLPARAGDDGGSGGVDGGEVPYRAETAVLLMEEPGGTEQPAVSSPRAAEAAAIASTASLGLVAERAADFGIDDEDDEAAPRQQRRAARAARPKRAAVVLDEAWEDAERAAERQARLQGALGQRTAPSLAWESAGTPVNATGGDAGLSAAVTAGLPSQPPLFDDEPDLDALLADGGINNAARAPAPNTNDGLGAPAVPLVAASAAEVTGAASADLDALLRGVPPPGSAALHFPDGGAGDQHQRDAATTAANRHAAAELAAVADEAIDLDALLGDDTPGAAAPRRQRQQADNQISAQDVNLL